MDICSYELATFTPHCNIVFTGETEYSFVHCFLVPSQDWSMVRPLYFVLTAITDSF